MIPKELRSKMNIKENETSLEIYVENDKIILSAYKLGCIFCGEMDNTIEYEDRTICKKCITEMGNK